MSQCSDPTAATPLNFLSLRWPWLSFLMLLSLVINWPNWPLNGMEWWSDQASPKALSASISMPDTITGTLEGNVYDNHRAPLPGVRLRVINQETGNQRATLTNIQGHYRIAF